VVELLLVDRLAVDLGDGVAWDATASHGDGGQRHEGAQNREETRKIRHAAVDGSGLIPASLHA
jgi:hypothetical protein